VKYAPEILSAVAFALLFLPFHYFLPAYLVVLAWLYYLGEWRYLPVISALGAILHLEDFALVALSLPVFFASKWDRKVVTTSLAVSGISLAVNSTSVDVFLVLVSSAVFLSKALDYRGAMLSAIAFLAASVFDGSFMDISYSLFLGGIIGALVEKRTGRAEGWRLALAVVSVFLAQFYSRFGLPLALTSMGISLFYPPATFVALATLYFSGFAYAPYFLPVVVLPYFFDKLPGYVMASLGLGMSFPYSLPLIFVLARLEKRALVIASVVLSAVSAYFFLVGDFGYAVSASVGSLTSSAVFLSYWWLHAHWRKVRQIVAPLLALSFVVVSSFLTLFLYYYWMSYVSLLVSIGIFAYVASPWLKRELEFLRWAFLVLLSSLNPLAPLGGYYLRDRWNLIPILALIVLSFTSIDHVWFALASFTSSISLLLQSLRVKNFKLLSYLPISVTPVEGYYPAKVFLYSVSGDWVAVLVYALLPLVVLTACYLVGRRDQFLGVVYGLSLGLALLTIVRELGL